VSGKTLFAGRIKMNGAKNTAKRGFFGGLIRSQSGGGELKMQN
jgi:hypothetical protein